MKYAPIPSLSPEQIRSVIFNSSKTMDEKRLHLFSAFYNLDIEIVAKILREVFDDTDLNLKLCALRNVDAFIQSRQTSIEIPSCLQAIEKIVSANPEYRNELREIAQSLEEFQKIFS